MKKVVVSCPVLIVEQEFLTSLTHQSTLVPAHEWSPIFCTDCATGVTCELTFPLNQLLLDWLFVNKWIDQSQSH